MARVDRNITSATPGQITATPAAVIRRLAISVLRVRGVVAKGRRR